MKFAWKTVGIAFIAASILLSHQVVSALGQEQAVLPAKTAETTPDEALAKVNGIPITRKEVERAVKVLLSQNKLPKPVNADQTKQAQEAALTQLISAELFYQAAQKLPVKDLDRQIDARLKQGREKFKTPDEFEKALKSVDLTEKELTDLTRKDIVINNLIEQEIAAKVEVTEADARKFYDENPTRFNKGESVKASHILIGVDPQATAEDKKKAREKAEAIRKRILAGEEFATLAKAESSCPSSAKGGDLGSFGKGQMVPEFEKAAFALKPGEVSEVVETQFGYHIIKLIDKKGAETVTFASAKEGIIGFLKGQKTQKAIGGYLSSLKEKAKIERPAN